MQITLEQEDLLAAVNMFIKDKMPNYVLNTADIVIKTNPQKKLTRAEITFGDKSFEEEEVVEEVSIDSDEVALIEAYKLAQNQPKATFDEDDTIKVGDVTPPWEQQKDRERAILTTFEDDNTVSTIDLNNKIDEAHLTETFHELTPADISIDNFEEAEPNDLVTPVEDLILAEPEISDDEDLFKID